MYRHFELRDGPDDLPYSRTYQTLAQARIAALKKTEKSGWGPLLVYEITADGERYVGAFG